MSKKFKSKKVEKGNQPKHAMEEEQDYKDPFINTSDKVIEWIEKNRKLVLIGIGAFIALLAFGGIAYYLVGSSNREASSIYYKANKDIMAEIKDAQSTNLKGGKLTDDEISRLKERYDRLKDKSNAYGNLATFNQGVIYYSVGNYGEAATFFNDSSQFKDFPLAFLAKLNLGHNYFNLAYMDSKDNKSEKAIANYEQAISHYSKLEAEFKNSPAITLAHNSKGLALEYLAKTYIKKGEKETAKEKLNKSLESYKKLLPFFKDRNDIKMALEDDVKVAIRRVEIELAELNS